MPEIADDLVAGNGAAAGANCTEAFSLPSSVTAALRNVSCAMKRSRLNSSASGRSPSSESRTRALGDDAGDALAQADVGQQLGAGSVAGEAQQLFPQRLVLFVVLRQLAQAFGAQRLRQQLLAQACDSACARVFRW
jgi:hypothetical protein